MSEQKRVKTEEPVKVGYWKIRGLLNPAVFVLEYLGVKHEVVYYENTEDRANWTQVKQTLGLDFPNLPYLLHGDFHLSESHAIMRYICNTFGPELLGKTIQDQAVVDMIMGVLGDIKSKVTTICYTSGDRAEATKFINEKIPNLDKFLHGKDFLLGDYVTLADFYLFEQEELFNFVSEGKFFKLHPLFEAHHKRMTELPKFGEFVKSDRFLARPFNYPTAKLNN